jgi:hypothetical protein
MEFVCLFLFCLFCSIREMLDGSLFQPLFFECGVKFRIRRIIRWYLGPNMNTTRAREVISLYRITNGETHY